MRLYQDGHLDLGTSIPARLTDALVDMKVSDPNLLGPAFSAQGKGDVTVLNLLLHNAGFPPDPSPGYRALSALQCGAGFTPFSQPRFWLPPDENILPNDELRLSEEDLRVADESNFAYQARPSLRLQ